MVFCGFGLVYIIIWLFDLVFFLLWFKVIYVWLYFNNCDIKVIGLINILIIMLVVLVVYRKVNVNLLFWGLNVLEVWFYNIFKMVI